MIEGVLVGVVEIFLKESVIPVLILTTPYIITYAKTAILS